MHVQLQANLQQKIQEWMDENCEAGEWPNHLVIGCLTVELMTDAAISVIDAIIEAEGYALHEGFYKGP